MGLLIKKNICLMGLLCNLKYKNMPYGPTHKENYMPYGPTHKEKIIKICLMGLWAMCITE